INKVSNDFSPSSKSAFLTSLYQHKMPANSTPLRKAMDDVGQYFTQRDENGPWATTRGVKETRQATCRQNFNILMTDGAWNGDPVAGSARGDQDGAAGATITGRVPGTSTNVSYSYTPRKPFSQSDADTLADVAMYYWKTNLRSDWNTPEQMNVRTPSNGVDTPDTKDFAFWPHLIQYTVGFGLKGALDSTVDLPRLTSGSISWPSTSSAESKIDDLWHAAVNSRGKYFNAKNAQEYADALGASLRDMDNVAGSASVVGTSSHTIGAGVKLYTTTYQTGNWTGRISQKSLHEITGNIIGEDWNSDDKISMSGRKIFTSTSGTVKGKRFEYGSLDANELAAFTTEKTNAIYAGMVDEQDLFNYLIGDSSKERDGSLSPSKPLRKRANLLGDLVNSDPQYLAAGYNEGYSFLPPGARGKNTYVAYLKEKASRAPTVFVGSNDGMLHAFNATADANEGGKERFAFVPKAVIPNMPALANPLYSHRYYVDGTPMIGDAAIASDDQHPWMTVLLGTTGAGGKSVFALDVGRPDAFSNEHVLWEKSPSASGTEDRDLGYTIGTPQIGRMRDGRWVAVFGNGYESTNGNAVLYVLDLKSGGEIARIVLSSAVNNGLATPKLSLDSESTIKAVYAGDKVGNVWKIDFVTDAETNQITVPKVAFKESGLADTPLFTAKDARPITTQVQLFPHPMGGKLVLFGTGKLFEENDDTNVDVHSLYGIWDKKVPSAVSQTQLVGQTLSYADGLYSLSQNKVDWNVKHGWFVDMRTTAGERIVTDPIILEDQVFFTSIIPNSPDDICASGGFSGTLHLSALTGGMLGYRTTDTNGDGEVNGRDNLIAGERGIATGGISLIKLGNRKAKIHETGQDGQSEFTPPPCPEGQTCQACRAGEKGCLSLSERVSTVRLWRQILGKQ
ncbi:MAG: hypothetical protein K2P84_10525, partial [Undibacterium sp.]|nr:hypothetical protein [Undibacterium sp.]